MPQTIICPNCQYEIEPSTALSAQLRDELRKEFEADARRKEREFAKRDGELRDRESALAAAKTSIDEEVAKRVSTEQEKLKQKALAHAKAAMALDFKDLQDQLAGAATKLAAAEQSELGLRKAKRDVEEQKRQLELSVARKMDEEREKIRESAKKEAADERDLKDAENDKLIRDLTRQIDDLKRKAEQGSQEVQGDVMEIALEQLLARQFPFDTVERVAKGTHGGDVLQHIRDATAAPCGAILWESKRTKAWSDGWLPKLRDDQRAAKTHFAVLVTTEMPKGIATFACVDGVWVTSRACAVGLAAALRTAVIDVATAKRAVDGQHDKMELLYNYLSSAEFRHRVEGIVESFATLSEDLEAEKRATHRAWAKREKQLERALACTSGMYGDLNGIIGRSLPQIDLLALPDVDISPDDRAAHDPETMTHAAI
ncbi:MAG TPA: DUF2130 domain-containing protein [Pirellulales bacterium]|nr:DUF2130 domain-containing protein [Pirellulales bacterium]